jgi:hypothetical protein
MVQRKTFEAKTKEVRGSWRTHCVMKIDIFDDSTNIIKLIK